MADTKALSPVSRLKTLLETEEINNRFKAALGEGSGLFKASLISAVSMNSSLSECEPMSLISSAMIAATLKLPITPSLGLAHIVPYQGVGTFQIGWKGLVQLGLRSGQYKTMNATEIYEGQLVKDDQFTGAIEFQAEKVSEKIIGYSFYFKLLNGFEKYTYMTTEECAAHAKRYSASFRKGKGRWVDDFDSMALKTVVKMGLSKWGVLSVEMQSALEKDESAEGLYPDAISTQAVPDATAAQPVSARLRDSIVTTAEPPQDMPI